MKTLTTIILMSIFVNFTIAQNVESSIKVIRKHFQWTNTQKGFMTVALNNQDFLDHPTDNGATLTGYFKRGKLYKIEETVGISYAVYKTDYYFWDGKLYFVYRTESQYKSKTDANGNFIEMDYSKTELKYQDRQYFKNGKRIRRIEKGEMLGSKANYPKSFLKEAKKYKKMIKNRYKYRAKYKMLQGTWYNKDYKAERIEIDGLIITNYQDGKYFSSGRIRFDDEHYYYQPLVEDDVETAYYMLKFTKKFFQYSYSESGTTFTYIKK